MTDLSEAPAPVAAPVAAPAAAPTGEACACGSGLGAARCCALDLGRLTRAPAPEPEVLERMGRAYLDGEGELAARLAREVLEAAPGQREALGALYNVMKDEGRMEAAEALVRRLALLHSNDPMSQLTAAQFFQYKGAPGQAEPFARMLVRLAPESADVHALMGRVFVGMGRNAPAEAHLRRAQALGAAGRPEVEVALARALQGQGRFDEARAAYACVLEGGDTLEALLAWAALEEADNRLDAASALLDRAAVLAPNGPRIAMARAGIARREGDYDRALEELEGLDLRLKEMGLRASSLQAKGQVLDALGRYDEAFEAFADHKRTLREQGGQVYGEAAAASLVARLKDFFTEGRLRLLPRAGVRADTPQPIFVVGFPRSGTTLVEQTLASHPEVAAGDELPVINLLADRMQTLLGSPGPYPLALSELWLGDRAGQADSLRDFYLNEAARLRAVDPAKRWFTDKMPLNETHLGLIHLLFPQSPVVHVVRHPLDVVLSVFSNGLTHGFNCAGALDTAARHYALIADLLAHYLEVLPLRYHAVRYEDLVADQEREVRALFDAVGEPFDARTLDFHQNLRPARTASYAQVREKLYDRSRFRYRHYLKQLEPVIPMLEPAIARLGYTIEA